MTPHNNILHCLLLVETKMAIWWLIFCNVLAMGEEYVPEIESVKFNLILSIIAFIKFFLLFDM